MIYEQIPRQNRERNKTKQSLLYLGASEVEISVLV